MPHRYRELFEIYSSSRYSLWSLWLKMEFLFYQHHIKSRLAKNPHLSDYSPHKVINIIMSEKQKTALYIFLLCAIAGFLFFYRLGIRGLAEPDEGRYAEVAREMLESGDWLIPRMNYIVHMEKPPMAYWLIAGSFSIFGVNEFAARFPSAIAAIISVIAVFITAKRLACATAGFLAGIVLITTPQFAVSSGLVFPDMFLTCFITLGFAFLIKGAVKGGKQWNFLMFCLFAGLGMLTKGPVTLVIMLVPVVLYLLIFREWRLVRPVWLIIGIAVFLAVAIPWYLYVVIRLPGLLNFFVGKQTVGRLTTTFREVAPGYLLTVFCAMSFPWFFFMLAGVMDIFQGKYRIERNDYLRFLPLIWLAVTILFFSALRSALASYILPAYPPLAIATGILLTIWSERKRLPHSLVFPIVFLLLIGALIAGYYASICSVFEKYGQYYFLQNSIIFLSVIFGLACLLSILFHTIGNLSAFIATLALIFPIIYLVILHEIPEMENRLHWRVKGKHLAEKIIELQQNSDEVVMVKQYYADLPFYLARPVLHLHVHREKQFEDPATYDRLVFFGDAEESLLLSDRRIFFVAPKSEYDRIESAYPENAHFLTEVNKHILFINKPLEPGENAH